MQLVHPDFKYVVYMGKDKFENEELIRNGIDTDLWFHVDSLSSAHVYLRLKRGVEIDDIPDEIIEDCCQLVKANSIEGCKKEECKIVYTMWSNLKKEKGMVAGQVGFHDNGKKAMKYRVAKKDNKIINRIKKTKIEKETAIIYDMKREAAEKHRTADAKARKDQAVADKLREAQEEEDKKVKEKENEAQMAELDKQLAALNANAPDDDDSSDDDGDFM